MDEQQVFAMASGAGATRTQPLSLDDALAWEREQPERFEFDGYQMVAMTGGTLEHAVAIVTCRKHLERQLPATCTVFGESTRLLCESTFRYPDLLVFGDRLPPRTRDTLPAADLAVEVVSKHSARRDRVEKLAEYTGIATTYAVVDVAVRAVDFLIGSEATMPHGAKLTDAIFNDIDAAFA